MAEATDIQKQRAIEAAQGYLMLDLPDAALRRLGIFDDPAKTPPPVEQLRGEAFRLKEDYERALQHFERIPEDAEYNLDLLMSKAWCFKRIGRLDKAIESMRAAYRGSPKVAIVLYNLACYFSLAGEKEDALSWLARAFRLDNSLRKLVPRETDFDSLRNDQDFIYLMQLSETKESRKPS
jgi:tetratricopeptide (TPR) repeat protein